MGIVVAGGDPRGSLNLVEREINCLNLQSRAWFSMQRHSHTLLMGPVLEMAQLVCKNE